MSLIRRTTYRFESTESQSHSHEVPIIAVECYFLYIVEAIDENAFLLYAYNAPPQTFTIDPNQPLPR